MKIAFIGAGNMGGAIASGLLKRGVVKAGEMVIITPRDRSFEQQGVKVFSEIGKNLEGVELVIIAVKPWLAAGITRELAQAIGQDRRVSVCSVVAGQTLEELRGIFESQPIFRIMPNTAVRVGEGMTFVAHRGASVEELGRVVSMFETVGRVMTIDEHQMDGCMALASCGVAYAMRYVRAAMQGGVELGVGAEMSQQIVAQTIRGAAALLTVEGSHPEPEIDRVTTPGGITIKGLNAMEQHGFSNAVIQGLKASK